MTFRITITMLLLGTMAFSQKTNEKKILGCWTLKNMTFMAPDGESEALFKDAVNTEVCFLKDGKFTTKLPNTTDLLKGSYHFSEDGKTLYQSRDVSDEGIDDPGQITLLDDKVLRFQTNGVEMEFERLK